MSRLLELKKLSLNFRRISSNLLNSDSDNADVNLIRFINFIDENETIYEMHHSIIDSVDFDFNECFVSDSYGRTRIKTPIDIGEHLKAQYDYAKWVINTEEVSVWNQTLQFYRSYATDKIQKYLAESFKPMIDYINDEISALIMIEEETERKATQSPIYQNIGTNFGTVNAQNSGTINSNNIVNDVDRILQLLDKLMNSLDCLTDVDLNDVANVKDDLESIQEQLSGETPKKNRLQKALAGVKKFVSECGMKLAVTMATGAITQTDWNTLIQNVEGLISKLG